MEVYGRLFPDNTTTIARLYLLSSIGNVNFLKIQGLDSLILNKEENKSYLLWYSALGLFNEQDLAMSTSISDRKTTLASGLSRRRGRDFSFSYFHLDFRKPHTQPRSEEIEAKKR